MIEAHNLVKAYRGRTVLQGVSLAAREGEFVGILGPNGSGKSTLLRLLSGFEAPDAGTIRLGGRPLASWTRRELARAVAVLQQETIPSVGFPVRDIVEMGRFPYQSWLGHDPEGEAVVGRIMEKLDLAPLADVPLGLLSGGERQRVALAKTMAQQPALLMLDEPTTFLDIGYQVQMMDYVRAWRDEEGLTVLAVLHDLNLAAQYCDRLLVMKEGRLVAEGTPQEVLTPQRIAEVYGTEPLVIPHPATGVPQILLQPALPRGGAGSTIGT
ncbi:ABC transporter ATP-binding protein [Paenibacillus sp. J31TS4]|uniref:heme ABC transporter ATP-binding protein n=1 Tax=Paenibacillus sp. J31TS4 TaxID=2807195 RepID=UPI001B13CF5C|nr:heme ABC transporter ATP-binding protein [Paenibacillus sp. J31TS4]GIP38784.1 ABC transporter ATP-binding protein [Paenibacillus sp. J31TS4]